MVSRWCTTNRSIYWPSSEVVGPLFYPKARKLLYGLYGVQVVRHLYGLYAYSVQVRTSRTTPYKWGFGVVRHFPASQFPIQLLVQFISHYLLAKKYFRRKRMFKIVAMVNLSAQSSQMLPPASPKQEEQRESSPYKNQNAEICPTSLAK